MREIKNAADNEKTCLYRLYKQVFLGIITLKEMQGNDR